jgi:glycosyltransferase involved in cell wall biosynthesis
MMLSTVILNWNRDLLLERTLASYISTVSEPYELIVVDNGSHDRSRQVLEKWCLLVPKMKCIFLDQNIGGEAINFAFGEFSGDLIHISENDQLFLSGWCQHVWDAFALFPDLGQLSLFGAASTDEGGWYDNPLPLRHSKGKILYESGGNVGTSSIIRGNLIFENFIRVHNIPQDDPHSYKFPDDGRLSREIKNAGYWCAWSDRYYVRNLGHELAEFDRDPDYYERNYASKSWVGVAQWKKEVSDIRTQPKLLRRSLVFPSATPQPEIREGVDGKSGQLWSMFDGLTAEVEVLDFIYTLIRLLKPSNAVETGTWFGSSAIAIGTAMRDNGIGRLLTIEKYLEIAVVAKQNIDQAGLDAWVVLMNADTSHVTMTETYEFAFFDTQPALLAVEFKRFYDNLKVGATIVFHDFDGNAENSIKELMAKGFFEGVFFKTPRGLFVGSVIRAALASGHTSGG